MVQNTIQNHSRESENPVMVWWEDTVSYHIFKVSIRTGIFIVRVGRLSATTNFPDLH
jgi:hypothetical protein